MTIHLVGIGGISMRGVAAYYVALGHVVSGCDLVPITLPGIATSVGHDPAHVAQVDLVIYTSAVTTGSPAAAEIVEAKKRGLKLQKRAEAIGLITQERSTITVSGMHGKSTTTGMIAHILIAASKDPLVMVGAPLPAAGGATFRLGDGPLVLEADEYDRSFLSFTPRIAVITNIEPEHLDYYTGGLPEILDTFTEFLNRVKSSGTIIANGDDENVQDVLKRLAKSEKRIEVIRYGLQEDNDYRIVESQLGPELNQFNVISSYLRPPSSVLCHLKVPGVHNQMNATAAIVVADVLNIPRSVTSQTLATFSGVGQRFEVLGESRGALYINDYAHHPTEVSATIAATRAWYPKRRLVVVFQPHQYARTKLLLADFVAALAKSDRVIITDIFGVAGRDEARDVTAQTLAQAIKVKISDRANYLSVTDLPKKIDNLIKPNDVVLLMGAGRDINALADHYRKPDNAPPSSRKN